MLSTMRRFSSSLPAKGLLFLLVLSFGIWGVGDVFRSHANSWVATVGNEHVLAIDYAHQRNMMRQAMESLGVTNIQRVDIDNEVLRQLIQQRLVGQWLRDGGLAVNRAMQARAIRNNRQFKDITGKFDKELFSLILSKKNLSEAGYLLQLREELASQAIASSLDMDDSAMPPSVLQLTKAMRTQTREAMVLTIPTATVDAAAIDDQKLQSFYDARKNELYMEPEKRTIEYVMLNHDDVEMLVDAAITDAMLQERYESDTSVAPTLEAARPALMKLLRSEHHDSVLQAFSTSIEDALAGGQSVGEAVAKAGVKSESKLLTAITAEQLTASTDPLLRAVSSQGFALANGDTSGLRSSENGRYFVVIVKEVIAAAPKPLEAVKADVRSQVTKEMAAAKVREHVQKAKEALQMKDLAAREEALMPFYFPKRILSGIRRPTVDASGNAVASDARIPASLQQSIFEHRVGEVAGPAMLPDGSAQLALVTGTEQPDATLDEPTITAIQDNYRSALTTAVTGAMFNALAAKYKVAINQPLLQQITQAQ